MQTMILRLFTVMMIALLVQPHAPGRKSAVISKCKPSIELRDDWAALAQMLRQQSQPVLDSVSISIFIRGNIDLPLTTALLTLTFHTLPPVADSDPCYGFMSLQL